jgi:SP family arabinose:H+ symporter-like MFS transporter
MKTKSSINFIYVSLITLTATLGGFLFGFDTAVISGTISFVKLQFGMSSLMEGWYVSSALLGCIAGVAISGKLSNKLGRKKVMLFAAFLFAISAIGCALAPDATMLILFRLIGGLGIGVASVVCPMYIAELAPSQIRGKLITYYQLAITIGILVAYFSNSKIQLNAAEAATTSDVYKLLFSGEIWRGMFVMGIIPALLFILLILFIPESPRWLALKNKPEKARKILASITNLKQADVEIAAIQQSLQSRQIKVKELFRGKLALPMMIGILLTALSQFSGINAIIYYGPSILEKAGFQLSDALGGQVTIGLVNMAFTFVAIFIIDRGGRKPLLMWGIAGSALSLMFAGILFAFNITNGWAIMLCIILFIACFAFSFGPVVWVVISEIFPTNIRGEAVAISTMSLWIANWIVGQFFPLLNQWPAVPFFVFALCCVAALWLTWKKIPETRGRSLEEIEGFWK